jgi:hypothetical protein
VASAGFSYSLYTSEVAAYRSSEAATMFASVNHRITPKFHGSLSGSYVIYTYQNPSPFAFPPPPSSPQEEAFQVSLGLSYFFTPWVNGNVNYYYDFVSSDLGGRSFDRNRASLALRFLY